MSEEGRGTVGSVKPAGSSELIAWAAAAVVAVVAVLILAFVLSAESGNDAGPVGRYQILRLDDDGRFLRVDTATGEVVWRSSYGSGPRLMMPAGPHVEPGSAP